MLEQEILIIDEPRFSHVCTAILELEGFCVKAILPSEKIEPAKGKCHSLIITSYPFRSGLLKRLMANLKSPNISLIVLSNAVSEELLTMLDKLDNAYCMIKPLDYQRFRSLVTKVMSKKKDPMDGYSIV